MRRTRLGVGAKSLERGSTFASRGKGLQRRPQRKDAAATRERARLAGIFRMAAVRRGRCEACGWEPGPTDGFWFDADHVIPKAVLQRIARQLGVTLPDAVLYDSRNARCLCTEPAPNRCHARWTLRRGDPPPVRECVREFARELDARYATRGAEPFTAWLDQTYPTPDKEGGQRA